MYRSLFTRDLFAELDHLQRGFNRSHFPALNVGSTAEGVEIFAFTPGVDPASIDVQFDRGVLSISGERKTAAPADNAEPRATLHLSERFGGRFRRVVNLPEDIDPASVNAAFRDGVLRISAQRKPAAQPRRIEIH